MTYLGDGANNMAHSFLLAGATAGMHVRISSPQGFDPDPAVLVDAEKRAVETGGSTSHVRDPAAACDGADVLVTDTWVSMGMEAEQGEREAPFVPYALTEESARAGWPA